MKTALFALLFLVVTVAIEARFEICCRSRVLFFPPEKSDLYYCVDLVVVDLVWVDLDFGCSTILLGQ